MERISKSYDWAQGKRQRLLKIDFVRFAVVGTLGFIVTAIGLKIFNGILGLHITPATFISSEIGLLSNFLFHEHWTYSHLDHRHKPLLKKFIHFHMSSWSGVVLITLIESIEVKSFHMNTFEGLVIAAGIVMFWNFFWTRYYIFKGRTPGILMHPEELAAKED